MKILHNLISIFSLSLAIFWGEPVLAIQLKMLMPLYSYPDANPNISHWDDLAEIVKKYDVDLTVIINPNNGPGEQIIDDYTKGIQQLQSANIKVLGYVHTSFDPINNTEKIKANVDKYKNFYNNIDGIFFDEFSSQQQENIWDEYGTIYDYTKNNDSEFIIAANPGMELSDHYFNWETNQSKKAADVFVTFENFANKWSNTNLKATQINQRERFSVLLHSATPGDISEMKNYINLASQRNFGYVFVTDDHLTSNPWNNLPTYLQEEIKYVQQVNFENKQSVSEHDHNIIALILPLFLAVKIIKVKKFKLSLENLGKTKADFF